MQYYIILYIYIYTHINNTRGPGFGAGALGRLSQTDFSGTARTLLSISLFFTLFLRLLMFTFFLRETPSSAYFLARGPAEFSRPVEPRARPRSRHLHINLSNYNWS